MVLAQGTEDVLANPAIVVEVLSKSTEAYERRQETGGLPNNPLRERLPAPLPASAHVEDYQRDGSGEWRYRVAVAGGRVTLTSGAVIHVDAVYEGAFQLPGG
jgi:hypothetical protein